MIWLNRIEFWSPEFIYPEILSNIIELFPLSGNEDESWIEFLSC